MRTRLLGLVVIVLAGCGGTDASEDASVPRDAPPVDAPGLDGAIAEDGDVPPRLDGDAPETFAIVRPAPSDVVLETAVVDVRAGTLAPDEIVFEVQGETEPRCRVTAAPYRCLIHLDPRATGAVEITVRALREGTELAQSSLTLDKQSAFTDECATEPAACITALVDAGEAAGWAGVRYENMDGLHSDLNTSSFAGIERIENGDALSGVNPGRRPADDTPGILLGNASVALTSPCCFSVPRRTLDLTAISDRFRENKLWWYPEHRDHGHEDFYFFSTVTVGISQGSSGSERDELRSLMLALGALPPAARTRLATEGQIWSALQYVSRRTRVEGDAAYLATAAHPNAMANGDNDIAMIQMARAFAEDRLPPAARVEVIEEDFAAGEQRLTTPESVARVWSGADATEHFLRVSAAPSVSPSGRPLTYHWRVLRAAADIEIVPEDDDGRTVRIQVTRHAEETLMLNGHPRRTSLGVVALFVHDGLYFSPPAFVTSFTADPSRLAPGDNDLD
ncbi:MAG: hypothetical protein M3Y87_06355 [Myxococcota bacterium]|nr:hypothetical protein [Myxococcota bacterium]